MRTCCRCCCGHFFMYFNPQHLFLKRFRRGQSILWLKCHWWTEKKTIQDPTTHCQWHNTCHLHVKSFRFALYLKQRQASVRDTFRQPWNTAAILWLTASVKGFFVVCWWDSHNKRCHELKDDTKSIVTGPITVVPPLSPIIGHISLRP